jgi:SAM-dependent methyltransferase
VQLVPGSLFELAEMQSLLGREWNLVRRRAALVASGPCLSIAPLAGAREHRISSHPDLISLHVHENALRGDLQCAPDALPIESASLQLVVVRHALDALGHDSGIEAELARVLAPGGALMLFGLNPLSPWRFWWSRRARQGMRVPHCRFAARMRHVLAERDLAPGRSEFLGGSWPARATSGLLVDEQTSGAIWHGAWLLVARKHREGMRAIPLRQASSRVPINRGLAQSPSRRVSP